MQLPLCVCVLVLHRSVFGFCALGEVQERSGTTGEGKGGECCGCVLAGIYIAQPVALCECLGIYIAQPVALCECLGIYIAQPVALCECLGIYIAQPVALCECLGIYIAQPVALRECLGIYIAQPVALCECLQVAGKGGEGSGEGTANKQTNVLQTLDPKPQPKEPCKQADFAPFFPSQASWTSESLCVHHYTNFIHESHGIQSKSRLAVSIPG